MSLVPASGSGAEAGDTDELEETNACAAGQNLRIDRCSAKERRPISSSEWEWTPYPMAHPMMQTLAVVEGDTRKIPGAPANGKRAGTRTTNVEGEDNTWQAGEVELRAPVVVQGGVEPSLWSRCGSIVVVAVRLWLPVSSRFASLTENGYPSPRGGFAPASGLPEEWRRWSGDRSSNGGKQR
jgi:hypothetical protein